MRKISLLLAMLMLLTFVAGCNTQQTPKVNKDENSWLIEPIYPNVFISSIFGANTGMFEGKLGVYLTDDYGIPRCGYVSENGGFAIEPNFGQVQRFVGGYAGAVKLQGVSNFGVIDAKGNFTSPLDFSAIGIFGENGLAAAKLAGTDKYGYIDSKGNFEIMPLYDMAHQFVDGYALVVNIDDDDLSATYGFIDEEGNLLADTTYILAQGFSEGLAAVWSGEEFKDSLAGFIDASGEYVIEPIFRTVGNFSEGLAYAVSKDSDLYGFIDSTGEFVIEPSFLYTTGFSDGLAMVAVENEDGEVLEGYINKEGEFVIEPQYYGAQPFRNGYASVATQAQYNAGAGQKCIIDRNGNVVVGEDMKLDEETYISGLCYGNVVVAVKNGKFGVIRLKDVI